MSKIGIASLLLMIALLRHDRAMSLDIYATILEMHCEAEA